MKKRYELTDEKIEVLGRTLFRVRALEMFPSRGLVIKPGDLGGFVESENNLDQEGFAWVSGSACIFENAQVSGSALVSRDAWVFGGAKVGGRVWICDDARVSGSAWLLGDRWVKNDTQLDGEFRSV